jgi:hypothetical protein
MAAAVLSGAKPGDFSIDNVVPEKLIINGSQAQRFKRNSWIISNDIKKEADVIL